jgi:HEAT repeat protein
MKRLLIAALALVGGGLWVGELDAHGGTYRGPGDTVPPGGGGGGGGPSTPGPGGPSTPGGGGPSTPGPTVPGGSGGATGGGPTSGAGPATGGGEQVDLEAWSFWWEFNKDPFLDLKAKISSGSATTGSADFFIGAGQADQARDTLAVDPAQVRNEIVPALLASLEKETNPDIVTGCLIALAKIGELTDEGGENSFEKVIAEFLKGTQEVSETAAISLGILASDASFELLEALVRNNRDGQAAVGSTEVDPRTQAFAAYGLGLLGARTASNDMRMRIVSLLADVLPRADGMARQDLAVACVISLGLTPLDVAPAPAADAAEQPTYSVGTSRQGQIEFLLEHMASDRNYFSRSHVPTAVARLLEGLGDESFRERAAKALLLPLDPRKGASTKEEIRWSCALALGLLGDCDDDPIDVEIRKALLEDLKDQQKQGRFFGLISLGKLAADAGSGVGSDANRKKVVEHLLKGLAGGTSGLDHWSALALGVHGFLLNDQNVAPSDTIGVAIREALAKAKSPEEVGVMSVAAGLFQDPTAQPILLKQFESTPDDVARGYVALGLGLLGEQESIEPIQKVLDESEYRPELLRQAAIALGLLGDRNTVDSLLEMLGGAKSLAAQASLASALGFIGDRRSVTPLVDMLVDENKTATARGFAAVALGIVADKEPLPWNSKIGQDLNYRASTETLNSSDGKGVLNIL